MAKVDRLRNRVEPFASLFWALGNVLANTYPPARHPSTAVHKACPYMVIDGLIFNEDAPSPPFSYLGMLFIYELQYSQISSFLFLIM